MAASSTSGKVSTVRGLGEIALRIENLDAMQKFYEDLALIRNDLDNLAGERAKCSGTLDGNIIRVSSISVQ
jgi:hypothetical protein